MKNKISIALALLVSTTAHAVSMSWSGTSPEDAARWPAQLEEDIIPFIPDDSEYLRTSGLSAGANLELTTDGFRLNFSTQLEQPTSITLFSFDEEENLSFSRAIGVAPITRDRNGTTQYLYSEEFLLPQEELLSFIDQHLELIVLYGSFSDVRMEADQT
ncbi:hypothetical protein [Thalassobacterium sedimentorum]|nr:hypothetical protein [Coraliomargarita sp. SDUM461004]